MGTTAHGCTGIILPELNELKELKIDIKKMTEEIDGLDIEMVREERFVGERRKHRQWALKVICEEKKKMAEILLKKLSLCDPGCTVSGCFPISH